MQRGLAKFFLLLQAAIAWAGRAVFESCDFGSARSQSSQDLGLRYQLARQYDLDMAWGPEDRTWYIQLGLACLGGAELSPDIIL